MPYTRRNVLKDTALLAAAGATGYWIKGCSTKPTATRPNYFAPGVRIFFEGTWLFCADPTPDSNLMRAVTLDIAAESHYFPYGQWKPTWNSQDDEDLPQLPLYKDPSVSPPTVTVTGFSSPSNMNAIFTDSQHDSPFTYLPTKNNQKYILNWNAPSIRVLSMPVPNRIIPAGYNTDASINDPIGHCHKPPRTCNKIGVATTHIFEYQGASSLAFSLDSSTQVNRAQDSTADYHFHTVPQGLSMVSNAAPMFDALLQLINNFPHGDVSLKPAAIGSPIEMGPNVPNCVEPVELEIFPVDARNSHTMFAAPRMHTQLGLFYGDFATCGGGGLGVGGCC